MYIAVIQMNPTVGALTHNARKALALIDELAATPYPPDLVVFPAYALSGAPLEGLAYSDAFAAECLDVARDFIIHAKLPTIIGTVLPRPFEGAYAFVCEPEVLYCKDGVGGALGFVDIDNEWDEDRYASSVTVVLDGHTVTVLLDDYPESDDDLDPSDVVIMLLAKEYRNTNSMFTSSQQLHHLRSCAQEANAWVVAANLVGGQDDAVFDGASVIIDNQGVVVSSAEPFIEQVLTYNLPLGTASPSAAAAALPRDHKVVKPLLPHEADWRALVLAIHDYVDKNGFSDVVLGLSGGIDSAVTAALAVDALGPERVHGVLMPGPYSSPGSVDDAAALANNLGIATLTMPITSSFEAFKQASVNTIGNEGSPVALQNLQARIRTIHLMHLSNTFGWLLLNTGNKSEAAMGFSTLYGDTAGAFAPLGNVYKEDVYALAAWRNQQKPLIPQPIIDKAPSAELYEGQRDEDTLPPYALLDRILRLHIEDGLGVDQILEFTRHEAGEQPLDAQTVGKVLEAVKRAEYKRRQEPLAPSIGYLDLTADRSWPLTNGFTDHYRNLMGAVSIVDYLGLIYRWDAPKGWDISAN